MTEIFIFFFVTLFLTLISKKFRLIPNFTGENHQLFLSEKKIPLIGGALFLIVSTHFFYEKNLSWDVLHTSFLRCRLARMMRAHIML